MKQINVEIIGESPLLMNNPESMLIQDKGTKTRTVKYDPKKEAEKVCYRDGKGILFIPSRAIFGCIINGASFKKAGKYSAKSVLAGNIRINPENVTLGTKKYEIDTRTVVIQRNRVIKWRPRLDKWKVNFKIIYNDKFIGDANIIKDCLEDAGNRVGLLDYRPQKSGSYGTFKVSKFEVTPNGG